MNPQFSRIQAPAPRRNSFDFSHQRKLSLKAGQLVPVLAVDVLPGDYFKLSNELLMRLAPLVAPMMHQVDVYIHSWFVPNRIMWSGWEDFYSPKKKGAEPPVHPFVGLEVSGAKPPYFKVGSIPDHLGYPTLTNSLGAPVASNSEPFNALPLAAYYKIFYEFYRDQNLQTDDEGWDELDLPDGDVTTYLNNIAGDGYKLLDEPFWRNWEQDYFTSALPWPQKGDPVTLPLGTTADLIFVNDNNDQFTMVRQAGDDSPTPSGSIEVVATLGEPGVFNLQGAGDEKLALNVTRNHRVDLSTAVAASIEDLRVAEQMQKVYELFARVGTRYNEIVKGEFDVTIPDYRLDRPEYLGGGLTKVTISEVLQTSSSDDVTPQGNMAGHGITVGHSRAFKAAFTEHGWIISLMSIMPKPEYAQGVPKRLLKLGMYDYARPLFAHLGEQEVFNQELCYTADGNHNVKVFGYQSRYIEYKQMQSTVHGDFKTTLDFWTWFRKFDPTIPPVLNQEFIACKPDPRVFADLEGNQFYCHLAWYGSAQRALPLFAIPQ